MHFFQFFFACTTQCRDTEIREEGFASDNSEDKEEDEDTAVNFDGFNEEDDMIEQNWKKTLCLRLCKCCIGMAKCTHMHMSQLA